MILWLLACAAAPSTAQQTAAAYRAVAADPRRWAECVPLTDAWSQADCLTAAAAGIAPKRPKDAVEVCARIPEGVFRDECGFQVAEAARDPALCSAAGLFAQQCRAHVWGQSMSTLFPIGMSVKEAEQKADGLLSTYGMETDDRIAWFGLFEHVLELPGIIDRGQCVGLANERRRAVCEETALHLYRQRLDRANARGLLPCPGAPMDAQVAPGDDPVYQDAYLRRAKGMNCPPFDGVWLAPTDAASPPPPPPDEIPPR